jgi:CheY-like chemotaxis protein
MESIRSTARGPVFAARHHGTIPSFHPEVQTMSRPRLLVVDDDSYTRSALRTLLGGRGWEVNLAATVAEGLAQLDPAPLCVILDLNLPDGHGESILRTIRSTCPGTRVAVCSAMADPRRLASVRDLAPEIMMWKPIEMAPLYRLCEGATAGFR